KAKSSLFTFFSENRHRMVCTLVTLTMLALSSLMMYSLLNVVTVQDTDNNSKMVISMFAKQDHLLSLAGFSADDNDEILYTTFPGNYTNITIRRTFDIPISVDGQTMTAQITDGDVGECLANAGVVLGEHDYTQPSLHSPISEGDSVKVMRVEYRDSQYEEVIPFETEYRANSLTYRFKRNQYVLREGSDGKNLVTYRERFVDGELESSLVSKVEVIRKPVNSLVLKYANAPISPLKAPAGVEIVNNVPTRYSSVISNVSATGYSAKRGRGASGLGLFYGSVAVNPNVIPYGSKLYITSPDGQFVYGFAIATDTGGSLMNGSVGVDLFYETYKESTLNWKNVVNIYVL
ncbi:MAG: 3D domain-containing protein, partial [Oscillospiraceae bacterium]